MSEITSYAAARRAGYRFPLADHYGGEQIIVRDRVMRRNYKVALSETAWKRLGYVVLAGCKPHARVSRQVGQGAKTVGYGVYREDQVEKKAGKK